MKQDKSWKNYTGKTCELFSVNYNMRYYGRPRHLWEDNIRMDLREIGWEVVH